MDTAVVGLALVVTAATAAAIPFTATTEQSRLVLLVDTLAMLVLLLVLVKLRADRAAAGTTQDLRLLADNAGDLVARLDPQGRVLFASPAARTLCGRAPGDLLYLPLAEIVAHEDRPALDRLLTQVAEPGDPCRALVRLRDTGDGERWAEIAARGAFDRQGRLREIHAALRDVTLHALAERELLRRRDHAEALAEGLERNRVALAGQNEALRGLLTERACVQIRRETIFRIGGRLAGETAPEALAHILLEGLSALTGCVAGAVYVAERPDEPLRFVAARGLDRPVPFEVGTPVLAWDMEAVAAGEGPLAAAVGAPRAGLLLPLRRAGRLVGAVWIAGIDAVPVGDAADEVVDVARQAAVALDTARGFQSAVRQAGIVRAVLDSTPDAIHLVDPDGATLMTNPPFRALAPLLGPAAAGPASRDALTAHLADPERYLADLALIADDPDLQAVHEYALTDSGRTFVRYTSPVRGDGGRRIGRVFVHREVTAERESERLKDEFLALVSHELRTPLTSVLGYLEVLLDGEVGALTEDQAHVTRIAERNARRLRRLVGDLLVVAQAQAGRLALLAEPVDVAELARQSVMAALPAAQERGVALSGPAAQAPAMVDADPERLGQVVDNLLVNAMTYTPRGGAVAVEVRATDEGVVLEVSDTGPGIPAGELERVFERFYRGAAGAGRNGGAGLGLAISSAIVRAHRGRISVSSCEGSGATFRVELPGTAVSAGDAWQVDPLARAGGPPSTVLSGG